MKRKGDKKKINIKVLLACLAIVYFVAFIGSIFTSSKTNSSWYQSIKPAITPPNWIFPIVWNFLFLLIGLSLYFFCTNSKKNKKRKKIFLMFGINFLLNILWSLFYFRLENPSLALFDLILLAFSIILLILSLWKENRKSSLLLVPYLLWICFAGILNYLSIK